MVTRWRPRVRHPAQMVVVGFAMAIGIGTGLLMLPVAKAGTGSATGLEALFTSTSAVCVTTGLVVVDTPGYWSGFGQAVILALIQVGGFGIMTFASWLVLLVSHRMGLRARLTAATETKTLGLGDVRTVVVRVVKVSLLLEAVTAAILAVRFATAYGETLPRAVWLGVFHAVSAFNNAGFALYSDSLMGFVTDPWICLPLSGAVIAGGTRLPGAVRVAPQIPQAAHLVPAHQDRARCLRGLPGRRQRLRHRPRMGQPGDAGGPLDVPGKLLAGFVQGVMPRTAGFNSVDTGALSPATWLGTDVLMFIGGASAGTAGGIKVTTFAVLFFVLYAEIRGEGAVDIFRRRLPRRPPAAGPHGGAALGGRRRDLDAGLHGLHRLQPGPVAVRGDLGLRHRRALDRHHLRAARG